MKAGGAVGRGVPDMALPDRATWRQGWFCHDSEVHIHPDSRGVDIQHHGGIRVGTHHVAGRYLQAVGDEGVGDELSGTSNDRGTFATLAGTMVDPMASDGLGGGSGRHGAVRASGQNCFASYFFPTT